MCEFSIVKDPIGDRRGILDIKGTTKIDDPGTMICEHSSDFACYHPQFATIHPLLRQ